MASGLPLAILTHTFTSSSPNGPPRDTFAALLIGLPFREIIRINDVVINLCGNAIASSALIVGIHYLQSYNIGDDIE